MENTLFETIYWLASPLKREIKVKLLRPLKLEFRSPGTTKDHKNGRENQNNFHFHFQVLRSISLAEALQG